MPESDRDRLEQLLKSRHACVSVVTYEEEYVLQLLSEVALERGMELRVWSVTYGLRDGMVAGTPPVPDSEHPAAALYLLGQERPQRGLYVMLDLAGHLKDGRTRRAFREAVSKLGNTGSHLVLVDHEEPPPVVS